VYEITRCGRCGSAVFLTLSLFFAAPSAGYELVALPPQPTDVAWPTSEWSKGSLPDDLDRAAFEASIETLFASKGRAGYADTRAILVVQGGRIVYERYADGFGPDSRFQSWSMAKSITNALTGVLVRQGRLDVDARAPVAAWSDPEDARRELTLRHLLQMRSGLENADGFGDEPDLTFSFISSLLFGEGSRAPGDYAANVPLVHPIGSRWAYSTGTSILIAKLCGDEIGGGSAGTLGFLRQELFFPIGIRSAQPEFAKSGEFLGGVFVHATARDWARFGYLYLRDGVWDGQRILPEGWVDFARTPNPAENNRVYGAHFWVNAEPLEGSKQWKPLPGAPQSVFMAEGASFQMVAVAPTKDLVAVRLGLDQGTPYPEIKEPFGPMITAFPDRR
jgi:CubicO group peptidase (beta-lactamase class C family)